MVCDCIMCDVESVDYSTEDMIGCLIWNEVLIATLELHLPTLQTVQDGHYGRTDTVPWNSFRTDFTDCSCG